MWDNVWSKPDQSVLGSDERKGVKMGFITHSRDQSFFLSGHGDRKKRKTHTHTHIHTVQFHTGIPATTHKQRLTCTRTPTHNATFTKWEKYQAALGGAGSENWVKNSAVLCYSKGCVFVLLH